MTQEQTPPSSFRWETIIYLAFWAVVITLFAAYGIVKPVAIPLLVVGALASALPNFTKAGKDEEYRLSMEIKPKPGEEEPPECAESKIRSIIFKLSLVAVAVVMGWVKAAIAVFIIVGIIATIHEFGHYIASKAVGVRVDEFSVGLGSTKLWAKQIGETEYSIRPIPLGAFVKPAGMDPEEEYEPGKEPGDRSFNKKNLLAKLAILFAGPIANIVLTFIIVSGLYFFVGDRATTIVVDKVLRGKPAALAGIRSGDIFLAINGIQITDYIQGIEIIGRNAGKKIKVKIDRPFDGDDGETVYKSIIIDVVPEATDDGVGKIGMLVGAHAIDEDFTPLPLGEAIKKGTAQTIGYVAKLYQLTLKMFKRAFFKMEVPEQIGGPLKIADTINKAVKDKFDIVQVLSLTAMLSMSIGVFNLLPIPALDGGRILVLVLAWIVKIGYMVLRKPIPEDGVIPTRFEEIVHLCGFAFLILLFLIVSWKDIKDMAAPKTLHERLKVKKEDCIDGMPSTKSTTGTVPATVPTTSQ